MGELSHTSFKATIWPRLTRVHRRQRIGVFAGPPGLGKTTVARYFIQEHAGEAILITVPQGPSSGLRSAATMQLVLEAVYEARRSSYRSSYLSSFIEARMRLHNVLTEWALQSGPFLTLVFDEAQNLSEEAIEAVRYLNDVGACYSPFRVGLIFIGNTTFRLKSNKQGRSILTDAVRDRALYADVFSHDDIADADLTLLLDAEGITDPECHRLVVRYFKTGKVERSLRQLGNLMEDLLEGAGSHPVTSKTFQDVVGL